MWVNVCLITISPGSPFLRLSLHYIFCSDVWVSHPQITSRSLFYIPIILSNAPFLSLKVQYISYPFSLKERERRGLHVSVYFVFHFLALVFGVVSQYLRLYILPLRSVPRRLREWKHAVCLSVFWLAVLLRVFAALYVLCVISRLASTHMHMLVSISLTLFCTLRRRAEWKPERLWSKVRLGWSLCAVWNERTLSGLAVWPVATP